MHCQYHVRSLAVWFSKIFTTTSDEVHASETCFMHFSGLLLKITVVEKNVAVVGLSAVVSLV